MAVTTAACPNCFALLNAGDKVCPSCKLSLEAGLTTFARGALLTERSLFNIGFFVGLGFLSIFVLIGVVIFAIGLLFGLGSSLGNGISH